MLMDSKLYRQEGDVMVPTSFSYDAIKATKNRRSPLTKTTSETAQIGGKHRRPAIATARDIGRNFSLLPWMTRMHIDYVARLRPFYRVSNSTISLEARKEVQKRVHAVLNWHGRKDNFDIAGRHNRDEFMRIFEGGKVYAGDTGTIKRRGYKFQGIESDRIAKPRHWTVQGRKDPVSPAMKKRVNDDGLVLNTDGAVEKYCVCTRDKRGRGLIFSKFETPKTLLFDGYYAEGRYDQERGSSPLLSGLNLLQDTKENMTMINLKIKAAAIFGLKFFSELPADYDTGDGSTDQTIYNPDLEPSGPVIINLDEGDRAEEFESKTPNEEIVPYMSFMVRLGMLTFDIPFSMFDSKGATFSSRIGDANRYEESAEWKRNKNIAILQQMYDWVLPGLYASDTMGLRKTLSKHGMTIDDVLADLKWVPAGTPWIDKLNQSKGEVLALGIGASSTPRICARYGLDAYDLVDEQSDYLAYAAEKDVPIFYAGSGQEAVQAIMTEEQPPENGQN